MSVIATKHLVKRYRKIEALKGVTLQAEKGSIFGLLGQNGAGKTTLVKILLGITKATEGNAKLLDEPVGTPAVRKRVGYLPEDHRFPDYHSGYSLLDYYGGLLTMPRADRRRRIAEVLELVGLKERMRYKIRTYSKGMKQRLGIAQAIMHRPEVIFLDEPTDGVDPIGRRDIRVLLQRLKSEGITIFVNSHLLGEVEMISDRVAILDKGEVIREGAIEELTKLEGIVKLRLAPEDEFPRAELEQQGYNLKLNGEVWELAVPSTDAIDTLVDYLREKGYHIRHLEEKRQTLEDLFMQSVMPVETI